MGNFCTVLNPNGKTQSNVRNNLGLTRHFIPNGKGIFKRIQIQSLWEKWKPLAFHLYPFYLQLKFLPMINNKTRKNTPKTPTKPPWYPLKLKCSRSDFVTNIKNLKMPNYNKSWEENYYIYNVNHHVFSICATLYQFSWRAFLYFISHLLSD